MKVKKQLQVRLIMILKAQNYMFNFIYLICPNCLDMPLQSKESDTGKTSKISEISIQENFAPDQEVTKFPIQVTGLVPHQSCGANIEEDAVRTLYHFCVFKCGVF